MGDNKQIELVKRLSQEIWETMVSQGITPDHLGALGFDAKNKWGALKKQLPREIDLSGGDFTQGAFVWVELGKGQLQGSVGRCFVRAYCRFSPPLAQLLETRPVLRVLVRQAVIQPASRAARFFMKCFPHA